MTTATQEMYPSYHNNTNYLTKDEAVTRAYYIKMKLREQKAKIVKTTMERIKEMNDQSEWKYWKELIGDDIVPTEDQLNAYMEELRQKEEERREFMRENMGKMKRETARN